MAEPTSAATRPLTVDIDVSSEQAESTEAHSGSGFTWRAHVSPIARINVLKSSLRESDGVLTVVPTALAIFVVLIAISTNVETSWQVSASWIPIVQSELLAPMPFWRLANFWYPCLFGFLPMVLGLYACLAVIIGSERAERVARATAQGPLHIDKFRNAAHVEMVRIGSQTSRLEVVALVLFVLYLGLTFSCMVDLDFLRWGIPGPAGRWSFVAALIALGTGVPIFMLHLGKTMRSALLRQHGFGILEYIQGVRQRASYMVVVQLVCLGYQFALGNGSPPFARSVVLLDTDNTDPCRLILTPEYSGNCSLANGIGSMASGISFVCNDGGWKEYTSAAVACHVAVEYFSATCKALSALALSINAVIQWLILEQKATLPEKPKYPRVFLAATIMIYGTQAICNPLYVGIILQPSLRPQYITIAVQGLWVLGFNAANVSAGIIMYNAEALLRRFDSLVSRSDLQANLGDGKSAPLHQLLMETLKRVLEVAAREDNSIGSAQENKFASLTQLTSGTPEDAALGINHLMKVADAHVHRSMVDDGGVAAIVREFETCGNAIDRECLEYVLHQKAGSSSKTFQSGLTRDHGRNGEVLSDFVDHPNSKKALLSTAHVLALRLYTSAAFRSLNGPLRNSASDRPPHPFPVTINLIKDGIGKLRAVGASSADAQSPVDLWRGLRDMVVDPHFLSQGGTELAPMSTTTDLSIAVTYSRGTSSLLFKLKTGSFMQRGADLDYLSTFPGEREILFPPLTYLAPTGLTMTIVEQGVTFTVMEVIPMIP